MSLIKTDESALIIAVSEAIEQGTVSTDGLSLPKDWSEDTFASLSEKAQKHLKKVLDDGGLGQFVTHELDRRARAAGDEIIEEEKKIVELPTFGSALATAKSLVERIGAAPHQYRILVRGPAELADRLERDDIEIKLSDQIRLLSGAKIPAGFALTHEEEKIDSYLRGDDAVRTKPVNIDEKALYFEFRTSGCISKTSDTKIVRDFFDLIRAFYGCAIAFGIIGDYDWKKANITPWTAANELIGKKQELAYIARADDDIIKATNLTTRPAYDNKIKEKLEDLETSLKPIVDVFSSNESAKLVTAAIWIFRANISTRQMDRILESTIALEVLLGDRETSDRIGLSKLMANRCAYALGKSVKERKEIIDFFVEFYKVRSDIVHNGRFKIEEDEDKIVDRGMDLAEQMLRHEINLIAHH